MATLLTYRRIDLLVSRPPTHSGAMKLGRLCRHSHDYANTGFSLRWIAGRHCVECKRIQQQRRRHGARTGAQECTTAEQIAQFGATYAGPVILRYDPTRYELGTTCKRGHTWPGTKLSLRRSDPRAPHCIQCCHERGQSRAQGNWSRQWWWRFIDLESMGAPPGSKIGALCDGKHEFANTGGTLKTHRSRCPICERKYQAEKPTVKLRREIRELQSEWMRSWAHDCARAIQEQEQRQKQEQAAQESRRLNRALQGATSPTVADLVRDEQVRENTRRLKQEQQRRKRVHAWRKQYKTDPKLRLYIRQKSKLRKLRIRYASEGESISGGRLLERYSLWDFKCAYCSCSGDLHMDHVIPLSKGGSHALANIVPACPRCNLNKKDHEVVHWYTAQPFFKKERLLKIMELCDLREFAA